MESITIKVDEALAREMERVMKPLYSTRTEFIREAVRDKIKQEKERRLEENFGKGKPRRPELSDREVREIAAKDIAKKHGLE